MSIEIFKTDVEDEQLATEVKMLLLGQFPLSRINFDLQDCDKVLRIEGSICTEAVMKLVRSKGIACNILD